MLLYVPHKLIQENRFQKRTDYGDIPGLAASIASMYDIYPSTRGLQQVPGARLIFQNGTTGPDGEVLTREKLTEMFKPGVRLPDNLPLFAELEFGHRRGRAFAHLIETDPRYADGLMPLDVRFLTDDQMLDGVWSENFQRQDLSAIEQAELIAVKLERSKANGGSQRVVAEEWKIDRSTVANKVRLLELPPALKDANRRGELSERQLQALLPVIELDRKFRTAKTMGKVDIHWAGQIGPYGPPIPPSDYVRWIQTESGRKSSSEDIRQYTRRVTEYIGHKLPETVAAFVVADLPADDSIMQAECRGCSYRLNGDHCLVKSCLEKKMRAYGESVARRVAEEHGLAFCDRPSAFTGLDDADLVSAFKKKSCPHLVVGWKGEGYCQARPFSGGGWSSDSFAKDSLTGVILGHDGKVCGAIKIKGEKVHAARPGAEAAAAWEKVHAARPGAEAAAAWEKAANKLIKKYGGRFCQALTQHLTQTLRGEQVSLFVQLIEPKGFSDVGEPDYVELLVRHFYERSGLSYNYHTLKWYTKLTDFLDQVGIGRDALWQGLPVSEQWRDQATIALDKYADDFSSLEREWQEDTRKLLGSTIARLLGWYEADQSMDIDGRIVEMVGQLQDAAAYIEAIERKAEEKEPAKNDGTLMQVFANEEAQNVH